MSKILALKVLEEALKKGVQEFCICAASRNADFVKILNQAIGIRVYSWFEERSAGYFALGRIKQTGRPVGVITTSGTAAGELLPAMMEGYYSGLPLLAITADRPRRLRGTGAPQTAEQVNLYGPYAIFSEDLADGENCHLKKWDLSAPAHLNVCLEDPSGMASEEAERVDFRDLKKEPLYASSDAENPLNRALLDQFFKLSKRPLVIVSALKVVDKEAVADFLVKLGAPCYLEATSGLRENPKLQPLRITRTENLWKHAERAGYEIDGVLRLGGVPTVRLWRDLEDQRQHVHVCSISELPFAGLNRGAHIRTALKPFFASYEKLVSFERSARPWIEADQQYQLAFQALCHEEPEAEPSMIASLSKLLPPRSRIYLGNSLPIREWDMAASHEDRDIQVEANRGMSGIEGQISTFLGWCVPHTPQFALLGDLTALYDLAGPWILPQLPHISAQIMVVNNQGGKIFSRMYREEIFQNGHQISFQHFAAFWNLPYALWERIPDQLKIEGCALIELRPNSEATTRFWKKLGTL
ncbi:2-succinyl-5-enolpyruvyl-6-hydroxy-3-cyclohexene-1-carboxylic-acid synthase [Parachlamydia sp. AcF125]|uniref:2-succinyl-5-enolpyruvyl-6-hydroxy-3- cyclohexene-1-carboxylic-acid synthase n=1 Tax=Parachlamydia sp. AcF125 TaxID=2795736 RepID=UPI001BCA23F3|nr:2-succinyl-5-enolpyruvyl-6-hydroxy-3-cyclohexene-1-carboxylic-acid synthase [Parachlamydia sp. AcF125]MBS4168896.1 2-succinyl-5-enolpyruvyl-6-hydroxy-3- cyclohexene-1-carboxylate synthase [Parachlamydia sp. AcF125]